MKPNAQTWSNLSGFKRDVIVATLRRGGTPGSDPESRPYGLGIKRELEIMRGEEIHHGRLYPNFDDLADAGLVSVGERDKRTNTYRVTEAGVDAFAEWLDEYVGIGGLTGESLSGNRVARLPGVAFDEQTSKEVATDGGDK